MNNEEYELIEKVNNEDLINLDDVINNPEKYNFTMVSFDEGILFRKGNRIIKIVKTSFDKPLINDGFGGIIINKDYFINNPDIIDLLLKKLCSNKNINTMSICGLSLITDSLIDTIIANDSINKVSLHADNNSSKKMEMTKELFEKIKESKFTKSVETDTVSEELKDIYDPIISNNYKKTLINHYSFKDLETERNFSFYNGINPSQLDNIKYIKDGSKLSFKFKKDSDLESVMNKVIEYDKDFVIVINVDNPMEFNKTDFFNEKKYDHLNILIGIGLNNIPLAEYKKYELMLDSFVAPIQNDKYSPFEKFIYIYNLTKRFKAYNEVPDELNKELSRNVYDILFNEYMVCVGFAHMQKTLLSRVGIENCDKSVSVKTSNEEEEFEKTGHARTLVHIVDQKYEIDGYYISDPTWDNSLEHDYYIYAAMNNEQALLSSPMISSIKKTYVNADFILELFESYSVEEFYQKINYFLNYVSEKELEKSATKSNTNYYNFKEEKQLCKSIITETMEVLKKLDSGKVKELTRKYGIKEENTFLTIDNNSDIKLLFKQFISEVADYVVEKTNKKIPPSTILNAAMVINAEVFGLNEEESMDYKRKIISDNVHRYDEYRRKQIEKGLPISKYVEYNQARFSELDDEEMTIK